MATTLTVLGSGDAFNSAGRGNACYLVEDDHGAFAVDFGPTALMNLKRSGRDANALDAVLLTHLHGDHFGGLHLLFIDCQYSSWRKRPLTIAGPRGTQRKVDQWYRMAYGSSWKKRKFALRYVEWEPGQTTTLLGRTVQTFAANHMKPRDGALHLKIRTSGVTLGFTGDTTWSDALPALAKDADLLVCECTNEAESPEKHLSWEALQPRLPELKARRLLLTHLSPEMRRRAAKLSLKGVSFADDFQEIRLTPRR